MLLTELLVGKIKEVKLGEKKLLQQLYLRPGELNSNEQSGLFNICIIYCRGPLANSELAGVKKM